MSGVCGRHVLFVREVSTQLRKCSLCVRWAQSTGMVGLPAFEAAGSGIDRWPLSSCCLHRFLFPLLTLWHRPVTAPSCGSVHQISLWHAVQAGPGGGRLAPTGALGTASRGVCLVSSKGGASRGAFLGRQRCFSVVGAVFTAFWP